MILDNYHKGVLHASFNGLMKRIEVEEVIDDSEDDPFPRYYRSIRFTTHSGDVLEVFCSSDTLEALNLVEVDELDPVQEPKPDDSDWLTPKVYQSESEHEREETS